MNGVEKNLCVLCDASATQSCSSCHSSFYCSRECQKKDWKTHKANCLPYGIEVHPIYGRYCVATRDISAGEIIMRDVPAAVGPKNTERPLCLGCHRNISETYHKCSKCGIPVCSITCETSEFHEAECQVLARGKRNISIESFDEPHQRYDFVLPLRCLLTKHTDPKKWKLIMNLQDSLEHISAHDKKLIKTNIIDYLQNFMNFKGVNSDEIYRICGILHTNSFEVMHNGQRVEGVFPKMAMMSHDCSPNTENIFTRNDLKAAVRSTKFIQKGNPITISYSNFMWNTMRRRNNLLLSKFFNCGCPRCCDPTELGSNFGTLKCNKCNGNILPKNPLFPESSWSCKECGNSLNAQNVSRTNEILYKVFSDRDRSKLRPLEDIIMRCQERLHPNHQIITEAKFAWIKFCGNHPEYRYGDISMEQLLTKIAYCRDLLETASYISPGRSQFRGYLLFELHASLKAMAYKLLTFGDFTDIKMKDYMDEAERTLHEVKQIFCFEDEMQYRGLNDKLSLLVKDFEK